MFERAQLLLQQDVYSHARISFWAICPEMCFCNFDKEDCVIMKYKTKCIIVGFLSPGRHIVFHPFVFSRRLLQVLTLSSWYYGISLQSITSLMQILYQC